MRICLDTSAYSNFRRSQPEIVDILSRAEWIGMPVVTLGELLLGFRRGTSWSINNDVLQEFLEHRRVEILPIDREVAEIYAEIYADRLQVGNPIPVNDIWIAATSAGFGSTLVTYDQHFRSISRIATIIL